MPGCGNTVANPPTSGSSSLSSLDFLYCQRHLEELEEESTDDSFDAHQEPLSASS